MRKLHARFLPIVLFAAAACSTMPSANPPATPSSVPPAAGNPATPVGAKASARPALAEADILDLAQILKLEDTRQFDQAVLSRLLASNHPEVKRRAVIAVGRIVNPAGSALLAPLRQDADPEI